MFWVDLHQSPERIRKMNKISLRFRFSLRVYILAVPDSLHTQLFRLIRDKKKKKRLYLYTLRVAVFSPAGIQYSSKSEWTSE